jgi:AcrR family transcriptional regulator
MARGWRVDAAIPATDLIYAIKSLLNWGVATRRGDPTGYRPFDLSHRDLPVEQVFDAATLAAAKQEALLASASWLFNLKGIDATSLDEIAMRVGVTKRVIYHNVGDKETLVGACYRRSFRFYENVGRLMANYDGSRMEAFCASTHANAEAGLREDIAPLGPLTNLETLPLAARDEMQAFGQRLLDRYLETFARGLAEGSMREVSSLAILAIHPGLFQWLPKWFDLLTPEQRAISPRELADLTRQGLRPL